MATMIELPNDLQAKVDSMIGAGRFGSAEEAVRAGIMLLHDEILDFALSPEEVAAIGGGLADEAAGRLVDADEVFARLRERYGAN